MQGSQKEEHTDQRVKINKIKKTLALWMAYGALFRYISCVLGCPYEGEVLPKAVADVRS